MLSVGQDVGIGESQTEHMLRMNIVFSCIFETLVQSPVSRGLNNWVYLVKKTQDRSRLLILPEYLSVLIKKENQACLVMFKGRINLH